MRSTKKKKSSKAKPSNLRVRDLRPAKDARAGAQKKETPEILQGNTVLAVTNPAAL
jgi:hypothetical protein